MTGLTYAYVALGVAAGGAAGAVARWAMVRALAAAGWGAGWPIVAVNALGSFLLGCGAGGWPGAAWLPVWGAGFCGGFTTFSTAMVEVVEAARGEGPADASSAPPPHVGRGAALAVGGLALAVASGAIGLGLGAALTRT